MEVMVASEIQRKPPRAPRDRSAGFGAGGGRLTAAFERAGTMPTSAEARRRLRDVTAGPRASPSAVVDAVESDPALTIAILRAANDGGGRPGRCESVAAAVGDLGPARVAAAPDALADYDVLAGSDSRARHAERFRRHGLAVSDACEEIALMTGVGGRDLLVSAALLHDVGRIVLAELRGGLDSASAARVTPEERLRAERREFGIDHAAVGAVLVRRWRLAQTVAAGIERHHAADATDAAAVIKLGDLVVHHASGSPITWAAVLEAAAALELSEPRLRALVYELPRGR
jgi:putative nucleotidyltransferase with HDIG domain